MRWGERIGAKPILSFSPEVVEAFKSSFEGKRRKSFASFRDSYWLGKELTWLVPN